jgi:hypothetical protein
MISVKDEWVINPAKFSPTVQMLIVENYVFRHPQTALGHAAKNDKFILAIFTVYVFL